VTTLTNRDLFAARVAARSAIADTLRCARGGVDVDADMRAAIVETAVAEAGRALARLSAPPAPSLLTDEQRAALESAMALPDGAVEHLAYTFRYVKHIRIADALHAIYQNSTEDQARWLLAADDRIRGGGG
jgi:hypothetical protein